MSGLVDTTFVCKCSKKMPVAASPTTAHTSPTGQEIKAGNNTRGVSEGLKTFRTQLEPIRAHAEKTSWCVSLEGNIASSKTSWVNFIKAKHPEYHVKDEFLVPELLKLFYTDRDRFAMIFQSCMLVTRLQVLPEIAQTPGIHIFDRSLIGDLGFCVKQQLDGKISARDRSFYNGLLANYIDRVHVMWYTYTTPLQSYNRLRKRGTVDSAMVPIEYLEDIHWLHVYLVLAILSRKPAMDSTWGMRVRVRISHDAQTDAEREKDYPTNLLGVEKSPLVLDEKQQDVPSGGTSLVDLNDGRIPLAKERFPALPSEYRFVHKEEVLSRWMTELSQGRNITILEDSQQQCLLHFWINYFTQISIDKIGN